MTVPVATVGASATVGVCFCHRYPRFVPGLIITNLAGNLMNIGQLPVGTFGSIALALCGHTGVVTTTSKHVGHASPAIGLATIGSTGTGCYNFAVVSSLPFAFTPPI